MKSNAEMMMTEMKKMARARSLLAFGFLFVLLLVTITSIQMLAMPVTSSFTRFSASFLNVILFLLPLFTLAIGALSIASDVESKWFSLLKTYPIKVRTYLFGKFTALISSFTLMLLIGYGLVLMIHSFGGGSHFDLLLVLLSFFSVAIFSSLSIVAGGLAKDRIHSLSLALGMWAFFLLIYDFIVMSIGTMVSGNLLKLLVLVLTFSNPAEWLRIGYLLYSGNGAVLGPAYYSFTGFFVSPVGIAVYLIVTILWVLLPLVLGTIFLQRKEG
ncbi:ABC transporter permease subunit [Rossellomorea oryzaecorticis]|uniref:ABC transporter permease subunit n=1 Tax=Rossellomorea oryzaecorticis TaxID=1396505 RepID=A0ABU9K7I8_9BACI